MTAKHTQEVGRRSGARLLETTGAGAQDDLPVTMTILRDDKVAAPQPTQVLLRRRLLTLSLVFTPIAGLMTAAIWLRAFLALRDGAAVRPAAWTGLALYTSLLALTAGSARILWSSRPLSLRALRTLEVAVSRASRCARCGGLRRRGTPVSFSAM